MSGFQTGRRRGEARPDTPGSPAGRGVTSGPDGTCSRLRVWPEPLPDFRPTSIRPAGILTDYSRARARHRVITKFHGPLLVSHSPAATASLGNKPITHRWRLPHDWLKNP